MAFAKQARTLEQATFARATRLGPVDTQQTPYLELGGIQYEIDDEYVAVVHAADAEVTRADEPEDPLPDL